MRVTFFSNYLNHHQLPFCLEMQKLTNNSFTFVATQKVSQARLDLGYIDLDSQYSFVIRTYESKESKKKAMQLAIDSDVIIHGAANEIYVTERMKQNKLTFRYSERVLKKGFYSISSLQQIYTYYRQYKKRQLYMLCASAYTAPDYNIIGAYKDKCFKWGYFPVVYQYDIEKLLNNKTQDKVTILWCGRFLQWKHPEKAIAVAKKLQTKNYDFELIMIGDGPKKKYIEKLVQKNKLDKKVKLLGATPQDKVRLHMEKAHIFIFTSNKQEGWGAVLNEAMNSGCAVVASEKIGSVPFLLKDGKNGFVYKKNSTYDLYKKVKVLLDNKDLRETCGKNAYFTLQNTWNAKSAAKKFLQLVNNLEESGISSIIDGPCSKAK